MAFEHDMYCSAKDYMLIFFVSFYLTEYTFHTSQGADIIRRHNVRISCIPKLLDIAWLVSIKTFST